MKKKAIIFILILTVSLFTLMAREPQDEESLVLNNVHLIDGKTHKRLKNHCIVVKGDTITDIHPLGEKDITGAAFLLNLEGHYVIPGLIDAHVHISHMSAEELRMVLSWALKGGITAVRDMGGDVRKLATIRRNALLHEIESPYIYYSAIMGGPTFFTDFRVVGSTLGETPGKLPWARAITPTTDMRQVIAEAKGSGAAGIKIYANLPKEEIQRIAAEGHKQGLKIWSHATVFPARPIDAVLAGVDVVSHCGLLAWESAAELPQSYERRHEAQYDIALLKDKSYEKLFKEMVKRNTILEATVYIFLERIAKGDKKMEEFCIEVTKMAHQHGVKIAAGTDYIYKPGAPFPNVHYEMELLVDKCGLSPIQALQSATRINAEALGIEDRTGTIEKGKRADLVILSADPSADIRNVRKIRYVIKGGKLYVRQ
ncbi:MAG: amidohydrolase family protein [Candidatus Aminicenantes bacterium]|nr:amidohydrolase family protein [Candidatus Aminicenantes bacterium]NIM81763.1 amidohydrolase family protein [Candidatus Aminicenantes bacterium]NIN21135.1 amidohydrolase family protein [Candidatus Aminicenantes bacterium]NIN44957.1 amidohydrolase family protein [Candidatus Aminicenantes bacterium]NIN87771.1 amidohydrolase family protein [Candidatus Aminicenantes bacterium]